ncbi:MAG: phosphoadenosine phosphosulfate reductase family protein, partial [Lentimicrobium sp.]|nr:phosphoadenosine phosphosulfate reductase family protein [Lentimicrobium sp.]
MKEKVNEINQLLSGKTADEVLQWFLTEFDGKVAFSTSMGVEDQVITHMIAGIDKSAGIFTLDTGRVFPETYDLMDLTAK